MYYLPETEFFGTLKLINVYDHYDVPRAFSVFSHKQNKKYIVYWVGESTSNDTWYYVPVSDVEVQRVESAEIQLRDIFFYKDIYQLETPFNTGVSSTLQSIPQSDVMLDAIPPVGFIVNKVSEEEFELDEGEVTSNQYASDTHEVRIYSDDKKPISMSAVASILGAWECLYKAVIGSLELKKPFLEPRYGTLGSYKMQFKAAHNQEVLNHFTKVSKLLDDKTFDIEQLTELNIDINSIEELISSLKDYNLKFELYANSGSKIASLDSNSVTESELIISDFNQKRVSSSVVPQANELNRIYRLVYALANGVEYSESTEGMTHRQIGYYKTASCLLGLIKPRRLQLTPAGRRLARTENEFDRILIIAELFENSECGWAWMEYCGVKSISDIDPGSATQFLLDKSFGLSDSTAVRRAKTLRHWAQVFKNAIADSGSA